MKGKSTHLGNVAITSTDSTSSELDYFDEHSDPVYSHVHTVSVKEINHKEYLIQFLISVNLEKVNGTQWKIPPSVQLFC